jgi:hypothetical protein
MADPVDEWVPVSQMAPADEWVPVAAATPARSVPEIISGGRAVVGPVMDALFSSDTSVGRVLDAFDQGAARGWGAENVGFSQESVDWFRKVGVFNDLEKGAPSVIKAFNEAWMRPAAGLLDAIIVRTPSAIGHALGDAIVQTGEETGQKSLARDIAALPGMFQGAPVRGLTTGVPAVPKGPRITGGVHDAPNLPVARDLGVVGEEKPSIREGTPAEAAANIVRPIEAFHGSPHSFDSFSLEKIGTGEGAQSYGHGLYFAENPKVSAAYKDKLGRRMTDAEIDAEIAEVNGDITYLKKMGASDPDFQRLPELTERLEALEKEKIREPGVEYQVRIHADKETLLDWDKPLSEQSPQVKAALKELGVEDKGQTGGQALRDLGLTESHHDPALGSQKLREAGIPGIKYLDQGSRPTQRSMTVSEAKGPAGETLYTIYGADGGPAPYFKTKSEAEAWLQERQPQSHNFVVFDDALIEITHKNGEPVEPPARAAAEARKPDEKVTSEGPFTDKAGNIRLDLIDTHNDAKNVIREAAKENGDFMPARRGDIPLAQVDAISQATGIPIEEMNLRGMGRLMRNDNEVRVAITAMIQSAEDTAKQMQKAAATGLDEDLIELQKMRMRHSVLQEQVAGLTAEWGRTGNVFQEFGAAVKDAKSLGEFLKSKKGETLDDLKAMAKAGAALDPRTQLPRFLHDSRKPNFWDKFIYYWTNALLSGPFSHLGYAIGDATFAAYEAAVITPLAGAIGKARELVYPANIERVYMGESAARIWGFVQGTPDAIVATYQAIKNDVATPLPRQVATGQHPVTQLKPIPGTVGKIFGVPSRGLAGLHSFFEFAAYRSEIEAQAYRAAAKEGLSPFTQQFWERKAEIATAPTDAMMDAGIVTGQRYTFTTPLGQAGKALQRFTNQDAKPIKLILPFLQAPINTLKAAAEGTPLAFLDKDMRANLRGENGAVARDTQWARLVAGSAVTGMVAHWAASDLITGEGPSDPKARAQWLLTHQPNSVRIKSGGQEYWVNYARFGAISGLLTLGANLHDVSDLITEKEYSHAAGHLVKAGGAWVTENTGMKGLADLIQVMKDPDRYGGRWVNQFAAGFIPFSTLMGQSASFMDPTMRDAKTFIDAFKNKIPVLRETIYPLRDWTGQPRANPRGGEGAIAATTAVNTNRVDQEMQQLNIWPTKVSKTIKGVELDPEQYDRYQAVAGALTRATLESLVHQDGWNRLPPFVRENSIKSVIHATRQSAAASIQAMYPELIQKGVQKQVERLTSTDLRNKKLPRTETGYDPDAGMGIGQ